MPIPQLLMVALFLGVAGYFVLRAKGQAKRLGSVQPGLDAVRAGFTQSRADGEAEPVCVVAFHYAGMSVQQVTIGVTDRRILVVKGAGELHAFPYDNEGEHLGSDEKKAQNRGFFEWRHGKFKDGTKGYMPLVKNFPPFTGEEWRMYPTIEGYAEQKASLHEFAYRFYFKWFYD